MGFQITGDIATFTLDDGKVNALGHDAIDKINAALDLAEDGANAFIIQGREGIFSGGFDLREVQKGDREAAALVNRGAALFHRLYSFPMPLIGACTGHAIAAGAFLLMCCDTRIGAAGKFNIGLNETAIGMTHLPWGLELIASRLAVGHISRAVIQAKLYDPQAAIEVGYLDEVVSADAISQRSTEVATALTNLPKGTYAQTKLDVRRTSLAVIKDSINNHADNPR